MGFAFVATVTPGPNNLMLLASGANFGFRRTVPHMFGILIGFSAMILLVGMGLMAVFDAVPLLETGLRIASVLYLLWLAWKVASAAPPEHAEADARPMSFIAAALFQWVNPKAWAMALSAITLYAPERTLPSVVLVVLAFAVTCLPAISLWAWIGTVLRRSLSNRRRLTAFNVSMALLLVASLYPVLMPR
ncbi:LysE family translocator [Fulvimarina sp. 2208YS6-2-32]|uniref:LysE family translocator n=2 Tax=Fulvimarina uroteuthidis TaxID=3098149 RepID=A0ABU5I6K1_9HYPH|nr:LysE family translocator [Fulvimarina sp. 2208YS6-2-32]MDY8111016.1 LysE family translocator [Fulvimarina sp. 2208YS6-2-32]